MGTVSCCPLIFLEATKKIVRVDNEDTFLGICVQCNLHIG